MVQAEQPLAPQARLQDQQLINQGGLIQGEQPFMPPSNFVNQNDHLSAQAAATSSMIEPVLIQPLNLDGIPIEEEKKEEEDDDTPIIGGW